MSVVYGSPQWTDEEYAAWARRQVQMGKTPMRSRPSSPVNIPTQPAPVPYVGTSGSYGSNSNETYEQAIARITQQIVSGQRDFNSVRKGIGSPLSHSGVDQRTVQQGAAAVRARVEQMFTNRGITPLNYNVGRSASGSPATGGAGPSAPPGSPAIDPATRLQQERDAAAATRRRQDAFAAVKEVLARYGLENLSKVVEDWVRDDVPNSEILLRIRNLPEFQQRFPAIAAREKAGLSAISPEEYINYERSARQLFASAGMPAGFYDSNDDFTGFLTRDVSLAELGGRVQNGFVAVASAPAAVREAFGSYFGANGDSALAAYFLDPSRALPVLEKQVAIGKVGGAGRQFGLNLALDRASQVADTGVGYEGAREGFGRVNEIKPIFDETIDERDDFTAEREGVDAVFQVGDKEARRKIEKRRGQRSAAFGGSGAAGAVTTQKGAIGIGGADR